MTLTPSYLGAIVTADGGQQVDKLRIATKTGEVVAEGYAPLEFSVTNHDKAYAKGDYKVAWFNHLGVSDYVDLQSFKTVGHVESIALTPTTLSAWFGEMTPLQLTVKTTPTDAVNKDVVYTTNPVNAGLSVQSDGKVYVSDKLPIGEYQITAKSVDGGKTAVCTLSVKQKIVTWIADFKNKIANDLLANPNMAKVSNNAVLQNPNGSWLEYSQARYDGLKALGDDVITTIPTSGNLFYSMSMTQTNVIEEIERKFGVSIWQGRTSLSDKINIAKQILSRIVNSTHARGSSPTGNKVTLSKWGTQWTTEATNETANIALLTSTITGQTQINNAIDNLGMSNFLLYAEPSNGTVASSVSIDHTQLLIEVDLSKLVTLPQTLMIG